MRSAGRPLRPSSTRVLVHQVNGAGRGFRVRLPRQLVARFKPHETWDVHSAQGVCFRTKRARNDRHHVRGTATCPAQHSRQDVDDGPDIRDPRRDTDRGALEK